MLYGFQSQELADVSPLAQQQVGSGLNAKMLPVKPLAPLSCSLYGQDYPGGTMGRRRW